MSESNENKGIIKRLFQDNTGTYVIGQPLNVPLILAAIGLIGSHFFPDRSLLAQLFSLIAFGAIFSWSYLEVMYGESLFRKVLGIIVLIAVFIVTLA